MFILLRNFLKFVYDYSIVVFFLNIVIELCVFMCFFFDKNEFSFMFFRIKREISRKIKLFYGGKKSLNMVFKILFCFVVVCYIGFEFDIVIFVVCFKF